MWYNGRNVGLEEYVELNKKHYEGKPDWMFEDEGLFYLIQDYASSVPYEDWTDEDLKYCEEIGCTEQDIQELLKED